MSDLAAGDDRDPCARLLAQLRRLLDDPRFHPAALAAALDQVRMVAHAAWMTAEGERPLGRLLLGVWAATHALEALAGGEAAGSAAAPRRSEA